MDTYPPQSTSARRVARVFYVVVVLTNLNFTLGNWLIFGSRYLHLSYLQTLVVIYGPATFVGGVLQVPAGAIADRFGRKRAFIVAMILTTIGQVPFLVTKDFWFLVTAMPFLAGGYALASGSLEAVISGILKSDQNASFGRLMSNSHSVMYLARVAGTGCSGFLYALDPRGPTAAVAITSLIAGLVVLCLFPADGNHPKKSDVPHSLRAYVRTTLDVFHNDPTIWRVLFLVGGFWLFSEMAWLGYQPALVRAGFSSVGVGICYAAFSLTSALGSQATRYLMARFSAGGVVLIASVGGLLAIAGFLTLPGKSIVIATVPLQLALGSGQPLANTYIAARTPESVRATALSFVSQFYCLAVGFSWLIGVLLLDHASLTAMFEVSGVLAIISIILGRAIKVTEHAAPGGTGLRIGGSVGDG